MPIRLRLKDDHAFNPAEVAVLVSAFEDTLRQLQLTDREDPVTLIVARRIIDFAEQGERDPLTWRDYVLKSLRPDGAK